MEVKHKRSRLSKNRVKNCSKEQKHRMDQVVNLSKLQTLGEYISEQSADSYFSGFIERLLLGHEFINSYNDIHTDMIKGKLPNNIGTKFVVPKGKICTPRITPFINLDNLRLQYICDDEDCKCKRYTFLHPEEETVKKSDSIFENVEFSNKNLLIVPKTFFTKEHRSKNNEAWEKYEDAYSVTTIARILFYILFCHHPLQGRAYYSEVAMDPNKVYEFFLESPKFIFDTCDNPNRFLNAYHDNAHALWLSLSESQRELFMDAFTKNDFGFDDFYKRWSRLFAFVTATVKTPCGEPLPVIVFDVEDALIVTQHAISKKEIRCRNCSKGIEKKCEFCSVPSNERVAKILIMEAQLVIKNKEHNEIFKKQLYLYLGRELSGNDIDKNSIVSNRIFSVVLSKNNDILGLKYLQERQITAECGQVQRAYKKDGTIALLPGTIISVSDRCSILIPNSLETQVTKEGGHNG